MEWLSGELAFQPKQLSGSHLHILLSSAEVSPEDHTHKNKPPIAFLYWAVKHLLQACRLLLLFIQADKMVLREGMAILRCLVRAKMFATHAHTQSSFRNASGSMALLTPCVKAHTRQQPHHNHTFNSTGRACHGDLGSCSSECCPRCQDCWPGRQVGPVLLN